ncbi:MAG: FHA domain-containing protein [Deltaproteobacteria bacterium]|nr:FHA domain-containing protein [Deltaproteobacteria bacterium]
MTGPDSSRFRSPSRPGTPEQRVTINISSSSWNFKRMEPTMSGTEHSPCSPKLSVTQADGRKMEHVLSADSVLVGRAQECDLTLDDPGVSRRHARIRKTPNGWQAEDLESANGLMVNGRKIKSILLAPGDVLSLGTSSLVFLLPEAPGSDPDKTVFRKVEPPPIPESPKSSHGQKPTRIRNPRRMVLLGAVLVLFTVIVASFLGSNPAVDPNQSAPASSNLAEPAVPEPAPLSPAMVRQEPKPESSQNPTLEESTSNALAEAAILAQAAQVSYDTGKLPDAVMEWRKAVALDPQNPIYRVKLETAEAQLTAKAEEAYSRGAKNYQFLKYDEAVRDWNQVLHLIPDPEHPLHQNAKKNLEQAQAQMQR